MKKSSLKLSATVLSLLLLFCLSFSTFALTTVDLNRKGSVTISMLNNEKPIKGGELTIFNIGNLTQNSSGYDFSPTEEYEQFEGNYKDFQSPEFAHSIYAYTKNNNIKGEQVKKIGSNGEVAFSDLELGMYLVVQSKNAKGYKAVAPFVVALPYSDNGELIYDFTAKPKIEIDNSDSDLSGNDFNKPTTGDGDNTVNDSENTPGNETTDNTNTDINNENNSNSGSSDSYLPQTGMLWWPIPLLIASGIFLISLGIFFNRRRASNEIQ